jgi:hypothetical protein
VIGYTTSRDAIQIVAVASGPVGLIGPDPVRSAARPADADADAWHPDALQHRLKLRTVVSLASGDQERQRLLAVLDSQVHLRCQSAA